MTTNANFRIFDSYETAVEAVHDLETAGVPADQIDIIGSASDPRFAVSGIGEDGGSWVGQGALIGGTVGGVVGTLAAIGSVALPGLGPVVAGGWLPATAACAGIGALAGAAVGGLVQVFGPGRQHHLAAMRLQRGATMVQLTGAAVRHVGLLGVLDGAAGPRGTDGGSRRDPSF